MPQELLSRRWEFETSDPVGVGAKEIETISEQKVWSGPWKINRKLTWSSYLDVAFPAWWEAQNGRSGVDLRKKKEWG